MRALLPWVGGIWIFLQASLGVACEELKWLRNLPIAQLVPQKASLNQLGALKKRWEAQFVGKDQINRRLEILVWREGMKYLAEESHPVLDGLKKATQLTNDSLLELLDFIPRSVVTRTLLDPRRDMINALAKIASSTAHQLYYVSPSQTKAEIANYLDSLSAPEAAFMQFTPIIVSIAQVLAKNYGEDLMETLRIWRDTFPQPLPYQAELNER